MFNPFKTKAVYSSNAEAAMSALEQVTDEKTLRKIASYDGDAKRRAILPVRAAAALRLNDLNLFAETVCREDEFSSFGAYLNALQNAELLALLTNRLTEGTDYNKKERKLESLKRRTASLQYKERQAEEKRRKEQKEKELLLSLKTDEERLACIKANILNESLIGKIIPEIRDRDCLLELLGDRRIDRSLDEYMLKRLGYFDTNAIYCTDCDNYLTKLLENGDLDPSLEEKILSRLGFSDREQFILDKKTDRRKEKEILEILTVEDCASLTPTIPMIQDFMHRSREFTEEVVRRYAGDRLAEELIVLMFHLQKNAVGRSTYEGSNIDWAAEWLHFLYSNGICKEMIEKQNGKVIHKAVEPAIFDMSDPLDREWASGYVDNSHPAIVFDAACENGRRYITDPAK